MYVKSSNVFISVGIFSCKCYVESCIVEHGGMLDKPPKSDISIPVALIQPETCLNCTIQAPFRMIHDVISL